MIIQGTPPTFLCPRHSTIILVDLSLLSGSFSLGELYEPGNTEVTSIYFTVECACNPSSFIAAGLPTSSRYRHRSRPPPSFQNMKYFFIYILNNLHSCCLEFRLDVHRALFFEVRSVGLLLLSTMCMTPGYIWSLSLHRARLTNCSCLQD